jgi:hypothetical protein
MPLFAGRRPDLRQPRPEAWVFVAGTSISPDGARGEDNSEAALDQRAPLGLRLDLDRNANRYPSFPRAAPL